MLRFWTNIALWTALALAATPALAATKGFTDHNPDQPIQFSADRLEVRKEGRVAVFFGDVEAIQGDLNLVADKVSVYYRGKTGAVEDDGGLGGTVSRIDARDNVLLTSRGDTVKGQWAVYDVSRKIVTLGGNVELRQGDTLVKGDRLELDLESGKSRIQGLDSSGGEQRVRGEFTPATSDSSGN